jgi:hypothetical protein
MRGTRAAAPAAIVVPAKLVERGMRAIRYLSAAHLVLTPTRGTVLVG